MKRIKAARSIVLVCSILLVTSLISGCIVRTYTQVKPREDQALDGNQGYIQGNIPAGKEAKTTKKTRTIHVLEIELQPPIRFERGSPPSKSKPVVKRRGEDTELWGNLGYVKGRSQKRDKGRLAPKSRRAEARREVILYTVKKGDTLQKISKHFFGTVKKWPEIYKANKDKLKGPEKIYPGQVIRIIK